MPRTALIVCLALLAAASGCEDGAREPARAGVPPQAHDATVTSSAQPEPAGLAKVLAISDLEGIVRPSSAATTTAALGRREPAPERELPHGLRLRTQCGANWCFDGLLSNDKVLMPSEPTKDDAQALRDPSAWRERVIRVAWQDDAFVSLYVAESSFSPGAAHANNTFVCRTYDRKSARALTLQDVMAREAADVLLSETRRLLQDPNLAIDTLGRELPSGYDPRPEGFRFGSVASPQERDREIVMCAEGDYPRLSTGMLELRAAGIPKSAAPQK